MILTAGGFKILRDNFGRLTQSQVDGFNFLVSEIDKDKSISYPQAAYILATTWHETAHTMLPVAEYGKGKGRPYGTWYKNTLGALYSFVNGFKKAVYLFSDYPHLYYGRGYVQLTWFDNYKFASEKLGYDFLENPDAVMQREYAAKILIQGMKYGWFTGKKLADYIHQSKKDYVNARRIINGTDKAAKIALEATVIEKALRSL